MGDENLNKKIAELQNDLMIKCYRILNSYPNTEIKETEIKEYTKNITDAINMLITVDQNLDSILLINQIDEISHEGMEKLKYIYNSILDKNNTNQRKRLDSLLNELKRLYKIPAKTLEEIQIKLNNIKIVLKQIDDFQNELNCKILYKKR